VGFAAAAAASSKKTAQMSLDDDSNQEPGADPVSVALAASRNELKTLADLRFFTLKISDMGLGKVFNESYLPASLFQCDARTHISYAISSVVFSFILLLP
jgi:hypothetical protein